MIFFLIAAVVGVSFEIHRGFICAVAVVYAVKLEGTAAGNGRGLLCPVLIARNDILTERSQSNARQVEEKFIKVYISFKFDLKDQLVHGIDTHVVYRAFALLCAARVLDLVKKRCCFKIGFGVEQALPGEHGILRGNGCAVRPRVILFEVEHKGVLFFIVIPCVFICINDGGLDLAV